MDILKIYKNGNSKVVLFSDGTKIRRTEDDEFDLEYPESMDCKISNRCKMGCPMCHENSVPNGQLADLRNTPFVDTLLPGTEIALGGGSVFEHPDLEYFLTKLRDHGIFASFTVHQQEFMDNYKMIKKFVNNQLVNGIGISFHTQNTDFIKKVQNFPNAVLHTINGITESKDYLWLQEQNLKILILGYKEFRRGIANYAEHKNQIESNKQWLSANVISLLPHFAAVSFDNLAIQQLNIKQQLPDDTWEEFYMGDDGSATFYIDLVEKEYARSSISTNRKPITDDVRTMFADIKTQTKN